MVETCREGFWEVDYAVFPALGLSYCDYVLGEVDVFLAELVASETLRPQP